MSADFLMR